MRRYSEGDSGLPFSSFIIDLYWGLIGFVAVSFDTESFVVIDIESDLSLRLQTLTMMGISSSLSGDSIPIVMTSNQEDCLK